MSDTIKYFEQDYKNTREGIVNEGQYLLGLGCRNIDTCDRLLDNIQNLKDRCNAEFSSQYSIDELTDKGTIATNSLCFDLSQKQKRIMETYSNIREKRRKIMQNYSNKGGHTKNVRNIKNVNLKNVLTKEQTNNKKNITRLSYKSTTQ